MNLFKRKCWTLLTNKSTLQLFILGLSIYLMIGCQQGGPSESPIGNDPPDLRPGAFRTPIITLPYRPGIPEIDPQLMMAPQPLTVTDHVIATQVVTDSAGGVLACTDSYIDVNGKIITRKAICKILPNAISGVAAMSMRFDSVSLGVLLEPEGLVFKNDVMLEFEVAGYNEIWTSPTLGFYYVDAITNKLESVQCDSIVVDSLHGVLKAMGAHLKHYSRYAFGR